MMGEFSDASPMLQLESLDVGTNLLRELGVAYLASARCLRELKSLHLDRCEIPVAGARELAKAKFLGSLRTLDIDYNRFGSAGLDALLKSAPLSLHTLHIRGNDLFDKGATVLAGSSASNNLLEVDLSQNNLGVPAMEALGATAHLRQLLVLSLTDLATSSPPAAALTTSPLGQRLAVLELREPTPPPEVPAPDEPPHPLDPDDIPF
jgi:Ran GTPase-activating protein (RanGAP) involved in mRNA processing and transport